MKIAIIYNRDSQAVINLFGLPNREKYGLKTIEMITEALVEGGIRSNPLKATRTSFMPWRILCLPLFPGSAQAWFLT